MKTSITTAGKLPVISVTQSLKQICKLHREVEAAFKTSLPKAIKAGELLTGLKEKIGHGKWLAYIEDNLPFSERTTQVYMRCFYEKDRLTRSAELCAFDLSVSGALALLSEPKTNTSPLPPVTSDAALLADFHEQDAIIRQSLADIKSAAANITRSAYPADWIDRDAYEEFYRTRGQSLGIELTPDDEFGFNMLGFYISAGAVVSRKEVVDWLARFNPARETERFA